jgi:PAS domain S-box-containing protein
MEKSMLATNTHAGDVILVSIEKRSGIINAIWPTQARLHGVAGKRCIGKKIQQFLTPASKMVYKTAISKKNKYRDSLIHLELCSKKLPPASYTCSVWNMPKQPFVLVIYNKQLPETLATGSDLIDRKQAVQMVQAAKSKFKRILEKITMPIVAYEIQEPKRFVFINPKFTEWFGYTIEDLPDIEHWKKNAYRDEEYFLGLQKIWHAELLKIKRGEKQQSSALEVTIFCKNGSTKDIEMSFSTDANLCYVTFNDVTDRNCITRELRESEEKFRNISEQLPIPICVFSDKGDTRFLNNAFTESFGYSKEDIPTQEDWLTKAYPDINYRNEVIAHREQAKQSPSRNRITFVSQFEVTCKDGSK